MRAVEGYLCVRFKSECKEAADEYKHVSKGLTYAMGTNDLNRGHQAGKEDTSEEYEQKKHWTKERSNGSHQLPVARTQHSDQDWSKEQDQSQACSLICACMPCISQPRRVSRCKLQKLATRLCP